FPPVASAAGAPSGADPGGPQLKPSARTPDCPGALAAADEDPPAGRPPAAPSAKQLPAITCPPGGPPPPRRARGRLPRAIRPGRRSRPPETRCPAYFGRAADTRPTGPRADSG